MQRAALRSFSQRGLIIMHGRVGHLPRASRFKLQDLMCSAGFSVLPLTLDQLWLWLNRCLIQILLLSHPSALLYSPTRGERKCGTWKCGTIKITWVENARHENAEPNDRGGKCEKSSYGTPARPSLILLLNTRKCTSNSTKKQLNMHWNPQSDKLNYKTALKAAQCNTEIT